MFANGRQTNKIKFHRFASTELIMIENQMSVFFGNSLKI